MKKVMRSIRFFGVIASLALVGLPTFSHGASYLKQLLGRVIADELGLQDEDRPVVAPVAQPRGYEGRYGQAGGTAGREAGEFVGRGIDRGVRAGRYVADLPGRAGRFVGRLAERAIGVPVRAGLAGARFVENRVRDVRDALDTLVSLPRNLVNLIGQEIEDVISGLVPCFADLCGRMDDLEDQFAELEQRVSDLEVVSVDEELPVPVEI